MKLFARKQSVGEVSGPYEITLGSHAKLRIYVDSLKSKSKKDGGRKFGKRSKKRSRKSKK